MYSSHGSPGLRNDRLHRAAKEEREVGNRSGVDIDPAGPLDNRLVPPVHPLVLRVELWQVGRPGGGVARGHRRDEPVRAEPARSEAEG